MTKIVITIEQDGDTKKVTVVNNTNIAWAVDNKCKYAEELKAISKEIECVAIGIGLQADILS